MNSKHIGRDIQSKITETIRNLKKRHPQISKLFTGKKTLVIKQVVGFAEIDN
jgi:macrodomain Ter protein organizer (MatP/YcbG family)